MDENSNNNNGDNINLVLVICHNLLEATAVLFHILGAPFHISVRRLTIHIDGFRCFPQNPQ